MQVHFQLTCTKLHNRSAVCSWTPEIFSQIGFNEFLGVHGYEEEKLAEMHLLERLCSFKQDCTVNIAAIGSKESVYDGSLYSG